jgi:hypothetical protein
VKLFLAKVYEHLEKVNESLAKIEKLIPGFGEQFLRQEGFGAPKESAPGAGGSRSFARRTRAPGRRRRRHAPGASLVENELTSDLVWGRPPNAVTPLTANWTLTDGLGNVINSRRHVTLTPAASISWLISTGDLAIDDNGTERIVIVDWTYNSTLGSNIPGRAQAQFTIEPVTIIPIAV